MWKKFSPLDEEMNVVRKSRAYLQNSLRCFFVPAIPEFVDHLQCLDHLREVRILGRGRGRKGEKEREDDGFLVKLKPAGEEREL